MNENEQPVSYHRSVLVKEILEELNIRPGKRYIDATLGDAGHTLAIAKSGGTVLGIDQDEDAIKRSLDRIKGQPREIIQRITLVKGNFAYIKELARQNNFDKVHGILFDLGASTYQLFNAQRGFSFWRNGPLDMRMDRSNDLSAVTVINFLDEGELNEIFTRYAEEHHSRPIARAIIRARSLKKIETTNELAKIVESAVSKNSFGIHPATKIFQALRISVNNELDRLKTVLPEAVDLLDDMGRLAVISYHSLEDRIVKLFITQSKQLKPITKRPIRPDGEEVKHNTRARSARLRLAQRL